MTKFPKIYGDFSRNRRLRAFYKVRQTKKTKKTAELASYDIP